MKKETKKGETKLEREARVLRWLKKNYTKEQLDSLYKVLKSFK